MQIPENNHSMLMSSLHEISASVSGNAPSYFSLYELNYYHLSSSFSLVALNNIKTQHTVCIISARAGQDGSIRGKLRYSAKRTTYFFFPLIETTARATVAS